MLSDLEAGFENVADVIILQCHTNYWLTKRRTDSLSARDFLFALAEEVKILEASQFVIAQD